MRISTNTLVAALLSATLLAACGGGNDGFSSSTPMSVASQIRAPLSQSSAALTPERARVRPAYSVLYSFKGGSGDGAGPQAALINVNGTLYGTTSSGGSECGSSGLCGTVFAITTSGKDTVLHSFGGPGDGADPEAALINVNGTLYGTTYYGGAGSCLSDHGSGCGTIFAITTSGAERVLYSFKGGTDGAAPYAGLINVNGTLYGTTTGGGDTGCYGYGCGTVFGITTSGDETVLHTFPSGSGDGRVPEGSLIDIKGTLYGTTWTGGAIGDYGMGTVFAMTTSGAETVLYSFAGGVGSDSDGANPNGDLINANGVLYGTTYYGGAGKCGTGVQFGCGTVFAITTSGAEKVLYRFKGGKTDGAGPYAGLTNINGTLYGTTFEGGNKEKRQYRRSKGTVFEVTTSGVETVLHYFGGSGDGRNPLASLIDVRGTLYGTTYEGGAQSDGTVFSFSP